MKIMPMGDYYVWHCDWCDSTNYTLWARIDGEKITCAACHHKFSGFADPAGISDQERRPESGFHNIAL
jgi:hypothetical protein